MDLSPEKSVNSDIEVVDLSPNMRKGGAVGKKMIMIVMVMMAISVTITIIIYLMIIYLMNILLIRR